MHQDYQGSLLKILGTHQPRDSNSVSLRWGAGVLFLTVPMHLIVVIGWIHFRDTHISKAIGDKENCTRVQIPALVLTSCVIWDTLLKAP